MAVPGTVAIPSGFTRNKICSYFVLSPGLARTGAGMSGFRDIGQVMAANRGVRNIRALPKVPLSYHCEPTCDGCGLTGLRVPRAGGFGVVRFYAAVRGWREPPLYYCEHCVEQYTGSMPYGG